MALVAGCAAPPYTYVSDSSASTYFKVPSGWHKISSTAVQKAISGSTAATSVWYAGYDASPAPSAVHVLSETTSQPFALALVSPLSSKASASMSYDELRDFFLPVTTAARQSAEKSKAFPLTDFHLLRNQVLTPGQGVHGVRVTFEYTYPDGATDVFDQVALTNADDTEVYLLIVHCQAACYRKHESEINNVMTSFLVKSQS
jgi:hypothetical protein